MSHIMEPVFHKLGMRLIARNMAMGGYGTTHFSAGSSTLYGETDILEWLVVLDVSLSFDGYQHYCSLMHCNF